MFNRKQLSDNRPNHIDDLIDTYSRKYPSLTREEIKDVLLSQLLDTIFNAIVDIKKLKGEDTRP